MIRPEPIRNLDKQAFYDAVNAAIERSRVAREAMSPVDRAIEDDNQRRSWVRGETGRDPGPHPLVTEVMRLRAALAAKGEAR